MPRSRAPRHAALRSPPRRGRLLAAALAVTTGLLASLAAAPVTAATAHGSMRGAGSLTLDLVVVADDGGSATGESFELSATATDGTRVLAGHDTDLGPGSTMTADVRPGSYALEQRTEDAVAAGYAIGAWTCAGGTLADGVVTIAPKADAVCSIGVDDRPATLTLLAAVVNDNGGPVGDDGVTLTAIGAVDALSGVEGTAAVTDAAVDAGAYALGALPVDGYALSGVACWSDGGRAVPLPVDGGVIVLANGAGAVCETTLDDLEPAPVPPPDPDPGPQPAPEPVTRLTLESQVDNGNGGDAAATDWTLEAIGPTPIRGTTGDPLVSAAPVSAGAYLLLASGGRPGYAAPAWACAGGAVDGSTVTVAAGADVVCTAVHDDLPVDLAITLDDGGAAVANGGSFDLSASVRNLGARGVDRDEPVTVTVQPPVGASVVEAPAGCTTTARLVACGIDPAVLAVGGAAGVALTLRFDDAAAAGVHRTIATVATEDDPMPPQPGCASGSNGVDCESTELRYPTVTLLQALTTDDGGDATLAEFSLTATGAVALAGAAGSPAVTAAPVPAGTYRLGATGPPGYAAGRWSCVGGTLEDGAVTIVGVVAVTCTISHDDRPVDLQLAVNGGDATAAGGETRFSLVVASAGGRDVDADEAVTVTHVLPRGLTYLDGPPECSAAGRTVTCVVDPTALPAGASVALELLVAVAPTVRAGSYESRTTVTTEDDPAPRGGCEVPSNNVACAQTQVVVGTVAGEKSIWEHVNGAWVSSDGAVGFGDLVQFRILVRAEGDAPSTGVGIVDRLPSGLLADGMAECSVPCTVELDPATRSHRVAIGTMEPGEVVTVTIRARVPGIPSQADGTTVRVAFDSAASLSSDNVESAPTNIVTVRASHALPATSRSGGQIPIGGISVALALLVAGGLLLVRSRELTAS